MSAETASGAVRIQLAGGKLGELITPTNMIPVERVWRRNPVAGTLTATPQRPFRFEMGAFAVPAQQSLVVLDWRFAVYLPSGVVAGNVVELEDRQLATSVGFDVTFTQTRQVNNQYELEPSNPATLSQPTFDNGQKEPLSDDVIARIRANNFASTLGSGLSTMPQRHRRDSQLAMPFTYILPANQRISFDAVVFRPINMPVAFFESELVGFLIASNEVTRFVSGIATSSTPVSPAHP